MFKGMLAFLVFATISLSVAIAEEYASKKVFLLASYEKENVCGKPQEEGAIEALADAGWLENKNIVVQRYYMDTKNTYNTKEAIGEQGKIAKRLVDDFNPDVLITLDDNAFREVGLKYSGHKKTKVIFSGLNGFPEHYDSKSNFMRNRSKPGGNITGIYEKLYVVKSIAVFQKAISSKASKIRAIVDYTPTGNALSKQLEDEIAAVGSNMDFEWELLRVNGWEEYVSIVSETNKEENILAIYPLALSLKDKQGKTYSTKDIFQWTIKNSTKPEMALNYFFSKIGLFGGAAVDFKAMGYAAGKKAAMGLVRGSVADLSIDDAPDYAIVFNLKRSKDLDIEIPVALLTAADFVYE